MIKRTTSGTGLPAGFPFSFASEVNGLCFISGMPALTSDGKYQSGTFEDEVSLAWHNVETIARASGYSVEEIVYVQCVLADLKDYGALNSWWRQQFPEVSTAPARFTFQAAALPFGCKVELQAVAGRANWSASG
jgi:2-iminobutanoate/2-iminopropanoate deaminase